MPTCNVDICNVLFIEFTIFEDTVVWSIIINSHVKDPECHFPFSNVTFQHFSPLHILGDDFSMQVFTIPVQVHRLCIAVPEPANLHVLCILLWGQLTTEFKGSTQWSQDWRSQSSYCESLCERE